MLSVFSHVQLFVTPCIVAHQASQLWGFSNQEYWSGLPCPSPGDLPDPGIHPVSLIPLNDSLPRCLTWHSFYLFPEVFPLKWLILFSKLQFNPHLHLGLSGYYILVWYGKFKNLLDLDKRVSYVVWYLMASDKENLMHPSAQVKISRDIFTWIGQVTSLGHHFIPKQYLDEHSNICLWDTSFSRITFLIILTYDGPSFDILILWIREEVSHSVLSNSLRPHGL